jgi:MFS family permease
MIDYIKSLNILQVFRYKNFRYYFTGKSISLTGNWIQITALSWYIYSITDSVFWLGLIGFISQIPSFIVTPFGGYFADRFPRLKLMQICQSLVMLQAIVLAFLVLSDMATIWAIVVLSFFLGCVDAFESPIRLSFVVNIIDDKKYVGNAIALTSVMFNGARLIGPAIAGYMIATLGEGYCFLANGICHIAVLVALFKLRIPKTEIKASDLSIYNDIKAGVLYLYQNKDMWYLIINLITFTLFGFIYMVLMPVIARDILSGDARTLGFLMSAVGAGALSGAIVLGSRKSTKGLSKRIVNFGFAACIALGFLAISDQLYITATIALVCGYCMMMQVAGANIVLQTLVDDHMRGRVMSLYSLAFLGFMPIGSLLAGSLSNLFGVKVTLLLSAGVLMIANLILRKKLINTL